ncbi:hypothetical protein [Georgenia alba]|uniref:Nucleotidyltransferase domain-containing protein n=1 Tax=Georgenia alba TaxID=2233858 RepID=A0ABW2Q5D9_9MICO
MTGWQQEREQVVDRALTWTSTVPQLDGLVQVGSGVTGFRDEWSDVDLVAVARPGTHDAVLAQARSFLGALDALAVTAWWHRPGVVVLCALLPSGLEVDLGVWTRDVLFASGPRWRVLAAPTPAARARLEHALTHNPALPRPHEATAEGTDPTWQYVLAEAVRARRGGRAVDVAAVEATLADSPYPPQVQDLLLRLAREVGAPTG